MIATALEAMIHVLDLVPTDQVLVVTDAEKKPIGEAFAAAAAGHGCKSETVLLPEDSRPLTDVPADLLARLEEPSVVINIFAARPAEVPFRVRLLQAIAETGHIRCGHSPGITEAMMAGPMQVDFSAMRRASEALVTAFAGATRAHITAPAGTDLTLDITGRDFLYDSHITVETVGNLPCGEIYCAPIEDGADGLLVIDACIGEVPLDGSTLRITLERGRITGMQCESPTVLQRVEELLSIDDETTVIGELGIGLNPGANFSGSMLEEEKAFRTAHIAFGNNYKMPGGRNKSATHRDFLFHRPTITVDYADGSRRVLLRDGDIQLSS